MPQVSERRKKPRVRSPHEDAVVGVKLRNGLATTEVPSKVIDVSDLGMRIETPVPLDANTYVVLNGLNGSGQGKMYARVVRCTFASEGHYTIGLVFDETEPVKKVIEPVADYYEVLQVHAKADPETIHRVYRLLAQRYHPDNKDTGNAEAFRTLLAAYTVLSDPEKRAGYDVHLHSYRQTRYRLFDQVDSAVGRRGEKYKRRGILDLLYTTRMNQPTQPTLNLHELEDLLGCPREHLEFTLWYLKEHGYIARADNGRFTITAKGVDRVEVDDAEQMVNGRLLSAVNA
jgi:hypothetical protein